MSFPVPIKYLLNDNQDATVVVYGDGKEIEGLPALKCYNIKSLMLGGTITWNQGISRIPASTERNGITYTNNNDGTITATGTATDLSYINAVYGQIYVDHKLLIKGCPSGGSATTFGMYFNPGSGGTLTPGRDFGNGYICNVLSGSVSANWSFIVRDGTTIENLIVKPQIFDLTVIFGSEIADAIFNMETQTPESGIAFFNKLFPEDYYPYDPGTDLQIALVKESI